MHDFIFGGMENTSATTMYEHILLDERGALDVDMDGSPDAVDCAPADDTLRARECTMICASDVDCAAGEACLMGVCQPTCVPVGEICRNGLDDDCDGMLDELDCM